MRLASALLLHIPLSSGFHTSCPTTSFSRINRLAAKQDLNQNEDDDGSSTDSRRDFMSTTASAAAATIVTFLPSGRANAGESTRDIFRKPELIAARKARAAEIQFIADEKERLIREEEERVAEAARVAAEKIAAEKLAEEKLAAEKIAAEKAAAEKVAAEKKAAEAKAAEKKPSKKDKKKDTKKDKKKNTPLPSAFAVPLCTKSTTFVTPETSLLSPSPLRQVDSEPPFLLPSSTMAEAAGITTASLDLSKQE